MALDAERVWPQSCDRLTVTPACVEECFGRDAFKDVSLDHLSLDSIDGRNKVDQLAKMITVLQATWFCIQFMARIHQSLAVSLLELNTFAHSLCALLIYVLWWHKPGEIGDPFVIHTSHSEALRDLCAAQWTLGASGRHYEVQRTCGTRMKNVERLAWAPTSTHGGSDMLMNIFRGRNGITLSPGTGEDWYILHHDKERWLYFPRLSSSQLLSLRVRECRGPTTVLKAGEIIPETQERIDTHFKSVQVDTLTLRRWKKGLRSKDYHRNYSIWLRDRQPTLLGRAA